MNTTTLRRHSATAVVVVVLFWSAAAGMVFAIERTFGHSPIVSTVLKAAAIIAIAFAYMRFAAPEATLDHALFVGVVWLLLAIAGEMSMTVALHRGWYALLGSPSSALRNVVMFAWIVAPALFARNR